MFCHAQIHPDMRQSKTLIAIEERRSETECSVPTYLQPKTVSVAVLFAFFDCQRISVFNRPYLESAILQMCMILTLILVSFERK